jgi:hypothetical protein
MSRVIAFESRQPEARVYPNRMWESPFIGNSSSFDPQGYFNLEARTTFHFTADGITPAMAMQMPEGKGSRYQTTYKDADGDYLDGSKTYKLTMPPDVPVALFWSVTLYDPWTRCELQSRPYPSISSQRTPAPTTNADGSIDIYFAAEKPKGVPGAELDPDPAGPRFLRLHPLLRAAQGVQRQDLGAQRRGTRGVARLRCPAGGGPRKVRSRRARERPCS